MAQNNLLKIAGKHSLKMGYELLRTRDNATSQATARWHLQFRRDECPFRSQYRTDSGVVPFGHGDQRHLYAGLR